MTTSQLCPDGILFAVRPGQTLTRIAQLFSVTVDELLEANPGIDPRRLQVGQVLCIPGVRDRLCRRGRLRTIRPGDSLYRISKEVGIPLNTLIEANFWLPDPAVIYPGEQICIPPVVPEEGCCIVLEETEEARGLNIGGVVLIEELPEGSRVTFAANNLPDPDVLGDFNIYVGDVVFREIERLVLLNRATSPGQPVVYAGTRVLDVPALGANLVVVFPYNTRTDDRGPDLLRGWIVDCR